MLKRPHRRGGALYALTGTGMTAILAALCLLLAGTAKAAVPVPSLPQANSSGSSLLVPSQDSFYSYSGPLSSVAPGTVLRSRTVSAAWLGAPTPITAIQLLYRTTNQLGAPAVTVTTVLQAARASGHLPVRILSYQIFYDGLGSECDPSSTCATPAWRTPHRWNRGIRSRGTTRRSKKG